MPTREGIQAGLLAELPGLYRLAFAVALEAERAEEIVAEALRELAFRLAAPAADRLDEAGRRRLALEVGARIALSFPTGRSKRAVAPDEPALDAAVRARLAALDPMHRIVLLLRGPEALIPEQIADLLRVTPKAVDIRLARAGQALAGAAAGAALEDSLARVLAPPVPEATAKGAQDYTTDLARQLAPG